MAFLITIILLSTNYLFADERLFKGFSLCDTSDKHKDREHFIEYFRDGTEFHAEGYYEKSKLPCRGKKLYSEGSFYRFEINKDEIIETIQEIAFYIFDKKTQAEFVKENLCGSRVWPLEKLIYCLKTDHTNDESLFSHSYKFKFENNNLVINFENERFVFFPEKEYQKKFKKRLGNE
jgi:hypothetical protein